MVALQKIEPRAARKARPTGETFDPQASLNQAKALYPKVMARLAE